LEIFGRLGGCDKNSFSLDPGKGQTPVIISAKEKEIDEAIDSRATELGEVK